MSAYVTSSAPISEEWTLLISRRAPIAMLILHFATQYLSVAEIESAVRSALGLPKNEVLVRHKDSVRSAALGTLGEVREFPCRCLCETLLFGGHW